MLVYVLSVAKLSSWAEAVWSAKPEIFVVWLSPLGKLRVCQL
jgi:hypothetical protein